MLIVKWTREIFLPCAPLLKGQEQKIIMGKITDIKLIISTNGSLKILVSGEKRMFERQ